MHKKRVYAGTIKSHMNEAVNQVVGKIRRFVQISEPEDLEFPYKITERDSGKRTENREVYVR